MSMIDVKSPNNVLYAYCYAMQQSFGMATCFSRLRQNDNVED